MTQPSPLRNAAFTTATPKLSVLIPFYKESPVALLRALATRDPHDVEIILIDDGSGMVDISAEVSGFLTRSTLACQLITLASNEGRARGRNRLTRAARGDYFLFLDADMLPDSPAFLDTWLETARANPAVVFGGFSLKQAPDNRDHAVHKLMAAKSDCLDAAVRNLTPEKYVFTSNLLVRRDVFAAEAFDAGFTGWGWEDTEWGMRVAARFGVTHIDNTATHMGLDTPAQLARKYEQSVANFARVIARHGDVVAQYPSYKVAKMIKRLPFTGVLRACVKTVALNNAAPPKLRALALRVYRAALYAQVV